MASRYEQIMNAIYPPTVVTEGVRDHVGQCRRREDIRLKGSR